MRTYFGTHGWEHTIPFAASERRSIGGKYGVRGIPTLLIFDAKTGKLMTSEGREGVSGGDDTIADFPWPQKTAWELLEAAGTFTDAAGGSHPASHFRSLTGGVGLYFSAHWCGPCRSFTPRLVEGYRERAGAGKALEGKMDIIFVSR